MLLHNSEGGFVWIKADPDNERGYTIISQGTFLWYIEMPPNDDGIDVVWGLATKEAPKGFGGYLGEKILQITCPDAHIHIAEYANGKWWMCAGEDSCPGKWEVGYSSKKGGVAIRPRHIK